MANFLGDVFLILIFALAILGPVILGGAVRKKYPPMPFWRQLFRGMWCKPRQ